MFGHPLRLIKIFKLVILTLFFYLIIRTEFLIWNYKLFINKDFSDILRAYFVGLRFDISSILAITAPALLISIPPWPQVFEATWRKTLGFVFLILQLPFLILNFVDIEFINFVGRRLTWETLFVLDEARGKFTGVILTYWHLILVSLILIFAFTFLSLRIVNKNSPAIWPENNKKNKSYWLTTLTSILLSLTITIVGIRGGFQLKPISFVNANVFTVPLLNNLVLNTSFTLIKSYGKVSIKNESYFDDKSQMLSKLNGASTISLLDGKRPETLQNVVILILESFGSEHLGLHDGKTNTPFLDELSKKSLVFQNAFANGRRSIEGVAAILAGVPALMNEPFISSNFSTNYFLGLGTLLSPQGYSTSFFHGGHNGTMHFDSFMQSSGIQKYFGSREYNNSADDDGIWGIWDEPFLGYAADELSKTNEPFFSSIFTLSSHHPFKVPEKYINQFPDGSIEILKTISYTDFALKQFFSKIEKQSWYKNTLFIITADHTSKHYRKEFENDLGDYKVPLMLFHPSIELPKVDTAMITQQIDILPTVLDFLGIANKEKNYLGSSVFTPGEKYAVNFIDGRYILISKNHLLQWSPGTSNGPTLFSWKNEPFSLVQIEKDEPKGMREELHQRMKANIQYFNSGMWDNKLYYPTVGK